MAQYRSSVDQFRWPGWANTMAIILYAFIFFITFRKVDSGTNKAVGVRSTSTSKNILFLNKVKSTLKKVRLRNVLVSSPDHKHKATNALPINDHIAVLWNNNKPIGRLNPDPYNYGLIMYACLQSYIVSLISHSSMSFPIL